MIPLLNIMKAHSPPVDRIHLSISLFPQRTIPNTSSCCMRAIDRQAKGKAPRFKPPTPENSIIAARPPRIPTPPPPIGPSQTALSQECKWKLELNRKFGAMTDHPNVSSISDKEEWLTPNTVVGGGKQGEFSVAECVSLAWKDPLMYGYRKLVEAYHDSSPSMLKGCNLSDREFIDLHLHHLPLSDLMSSA
jgi:hypothetical protein